MSDALCAVCEALQKDALDAIVRHVRAQSDFAIARIRHDVSKFMDLESGVEQLARERELAVHIYCEHVNMHTKAASDSHRVGTK